MAVSRRSFISSLGIILCAPSIIRTPGLLMPVKRVIVPVTSLWSINNLKGYMYSLELSDILRTEISPLAEFRAIANADVLTYPALD